MMNEAHAGQIAEVAAAAMREAIDGVRVGRINGGPGSAFAFVDIELPNGQSFRIKIEEN